MIAVCTRHPDCAVTHDDATVCPVCVLVDDATHRADNATRQLEHILATLAPLASFLVRPTAPTETPGQTGAIRVTITRDPEPTVDPEPSVEDQIVARVTTDPVDGLSVEQAVTSMVEAHGIRAAKNAYRRHTGESANRAWSAADLAFAWADRLFPTEPAEEPALQSVQPDPDENVVEEPEPTATDDGFPF